VTRDAIVIGAGIVGSTCAIRLQTAGIATTLIDPETMPLAASWGNAGHIAIEQIEPLASWATLQSLPGRLLMADPSIAFPRRDIASWLPFGWRFVQAARAARFHQGKEALSSLMSDAMPAWRRLVGTLGSPELLRENGHFMVWTSPHNAATARKEFATKDGGSARFREAQANELASLTTLIGRPPVHAVRCIGSGQISDHTDLFAACRAVFTDRGGRYQRARATGMCIEGAKGTVILDDGTRLRPDIILVAAGVRSAALMESLGHRVPMIAERGYHLHSPGQRWPTDLPPVVFEEFSLIVSRFRSGVRASSFLEFARPDTPPDTRKWQRLRNRITALGLPFELPGNEWMGCRPTLPDYLPAIGRSRRASNVLYAFGHHHLGLTLAPVTAEALISLTDPGGAAHDATAMLRLFDIERF
jgi:D-amino-acid dehydrogenase